MLAGLDVFFTPWFFSPEIWFAVAILLIIVDLLVGLEFFVLSSGIGALAIAILLWAQEREVVTLFSSWREVAISFALLSMVSVIVVKKFVRRREGEEADINDY